MLDYYHERLKENPAALAYLQKRGIDAARRSRPSGSALSIARWACGCRNNQRKEGAAIRERLTRLGILRDTGHEHLRGRIVFPVIAESGEIGTVYGRAIDERRQARPAPVFARAATRHLEPGRAQVPRSDHHRRHHRRADVLVRGLPQRDDRLQREGAARGTARRPASRRRWRGCSSPSTATKPETRARPRRRRSCSPTASNVAARDVPPRPWTPTVRPAGAAPPRNPSACCCAPRCRSASTRRVARRAVFATRPRRRAFFFSC